MLWQFCYEPESIFDLLFHRNTPVGPQRLFSGQDEPERSWTSLRLKEGIADKGMS